MVEYRAVAQLLRRPARLGSYCRTTQYPGRYPHVRALDLRDELVTWGDGEWPDVERLTLRPRGNLARSVAWAGQVLGAGRSFPLLRELRLMERADDVLEHLLGSPLLPQLVELECTSSITNRGAQLLHANADRFMHLERIWLGSDRLEYPSDRAALPPGTLEIDHGWRYRLGQRLGRRLRFDVRPGPMDL